jgi:hypothetical protein
MIGPSQIERACQGEIVVLPRLLQRTGSFADLFRVAVAAVAARSPQKAKRASAEGFTRIHEFFDDEDFAAATHRLRAALYLLAENLVKGWIERDLHTESLHVCRNAYVRFSPPCAYYETSRIFGREILFSPPGPHRDSWLGYPPESLTVWCAMSPIAPGNGLVFYPEAWRNERFRSTADLPESNRALGRTVSFPLDQGDALLFLGDQLHAAEKNTTDETRFTITARFTVQRPADLPTNPFEWLSASHRPSLP